MTIFEKRFKKAKEDMYKRKNILYTEDNIYIEKSNVELKDSFKEKSKKSVKAFRDWV